MMEKYQKDTWECLCGIRRLRGAESLGQPVQYASILPGLPFGFRFPELRSAKPRANCMTLNVLGVNHA